MEELQAPLDDNYSQLIAHKLGTTAQWWEQLLFSTGGKLELSKCLFYIMHWEFDSNGVAYLLNPEELKVNIKIIQSTDGSRAAIKHKDCHASHRTLGVLECPALIYTDEEARLRKKAHDLTRPLLTDTLQAGDAMTMYWSMFLSGVGYSLMVMSFTEMTLASIQSFPIQVLLPQM